MECAHRFGLGVLGVPRHDVEVEWELTFYPRFDGLDATTNHWRSERHFNDGLAWYGDADTPWNRRIEFYLADCGVTQEEIDRFRSIMLEPLVSQFEGGFAASRNASGWLD